MEKNIGHKLAQLSTLQIAGGHVNHCKLFRRWPGKILYLFSLNEQCMHMIKCLNGTKKGIE